MLCLLQYADHTVIFLDGSEKHLNNKFHFFQFANIHAER